MGKITFFWHLDLSFGVKNLLLDGADNFLLGLQLSRCCPRGFLLERLHLPGQEIHLPGQEIHLPGQEIHLPGQESKPDQTLSDGDQPKDNGNSNQTIMATQPTIVDSIVYL